MKKRIISFVVCFVLILVFFVGCGQVALKDNPSATAVSTGNGGLCVQKGDYLYFTNGYFKVENFNESTYLDGEDYLGAIYRAKLVNGQLEYQDDKLKNVELVCNKIVGNEITKLYIFGNKIYFASPNTLKDSTGKIRTDLPVFYSVNVDSTGLKELYAPQTYSNGQYAYYSDGTNTYLSVFDGSTLKILTFNAKNKCTSEKTVATGVSSVLMPNINAYNPTNANLSENNATIYYTRSFKDDENLTNGNVMAKVLVNNATETKLKSDNINTYTLKELKNGKVYFTKADFQNYFSSTNYYYIEANATDFATNDGTQVTATSYKNVLIVDDENGVNRGVVVYNETSLYYIASVNTASVQLYTGTITVLRTKGNEVFFVEENILKKINILDSTLTILSADEIKVNTDATTNYSLDTNSSYIYYYVSYVGDNDVTGYYLARTKISALTPTTELVGRVLAKHIKTPAEE